MCSSLEPRVPFKGDFEWLVQAESLPGGNASLSGVRSRAELPGLQWTLRRNPWGRAQTEEVTRSSEGGGDLPSLWSDFQLQLFSGKEYAKGGSLQVCLSLVATSNIWGSEVSTWDTVSTIHLNIFSSSLLLLEGRCSRMWLLVLQNNGIFVLLGNLASSSPITSFCRSRNWG